MQKIKTGIKLCKDCKWCVPTSSKWFGLIKKYKTYSKCRKAQEKPEKIDLVTGQVTPAEFKNADAFRLDLATEHYCGKEAVYWEKR